MAWTTPRTWTTTELVTKSIMDTHVRDNLNAVHMTQVTALPGSPFDGQLIKFTDSLSAPTYNWQLVYNATSASSFKWEAIGEGSTLRSAEADLNIANVTSYAMTDSPAAILAPLAGEYDVLITATAATMTATGIVAYWSYNVNGTGASDSIAAKVQALGAGSLYFTYRQTLAASDQVRLAYRQSNSGTSVQLDNVRVELRPFRVG